MSFSVEDLRSNITEASGHRVQLLVGGVQVFGAKSHGELNGHPNVGELEKTNIPKSAITISESASLVRYNIFSGLVIC